MHASSLEQKAKVLETFLIGRLAKTRKNLEKAGLVEGIRPAYMAPPANESWSSFLY